MGRAWKSLEVHSGDSRHCREWTVKGTSCEGSEEECCREGFSFLKEYLCGNENVVRNMDRKGYSERSQMELRGIGKWRKGDPVYKVERALLNSV